MLGNEVVIDGVKFVRADRIANRVSCWGMYDCHAFVKFEADTIDGVFEAWKAKCAEKKGSRYGAPDLCPIIVMDGQKELRRVGSMIYIDTPQGWHRWLDPVRADPEIAGVLASTFSGEADAN